jgi:glyoxylase-like metal-dependent hydrolase (beta-lactamase superfamily II)
MSIRTLDCAPMAPRYPRWRLGTPCLLVDTDQGLVLVDTGLGLHDFLAPGPLVRLFGWALRFPPDAEHAAVRQLSRLGQDPESVRHIVMTHLHFDHAGGLPDFPHAQVHIHRREYEAMLHPRCLLEPGYDGLDFAHDPSWVLYDQPMEDWLGFEAFRLPFTPEMYLVPLFGHTRGHCGVAIEDGHGWVFQCADALPTNADFDLTPPWLNRLVIGPHVARLREWASRHPEVRLLAGHMRHPFLDPQGAA